MAIIERTNYFAKPGAESRVLAIRQRACAVRLSIGLPPGEIFQNHGASDETAPDVSRQPDVSWQCAFLDEEAHHADLAARGKSAEFEAVRSYMRDAITRFERHVYSKIDVSLASGMRDTNLAGWAVRPREVTFRSGGYRLTGWLHLPPGNGPFPCLITNHGSGIDKGSEDSSRPGTAALLMSWGIASFLPHRRGYGASEGPGWRDEVTAAYGTPEYDKSLAERLDRESDDVLAATETVAELPEIDSRHIGVMGSSFGGTTTLLAAAKSKRFSCVVEFAGAAMNWDRTPGLRALLLGAAGKVTAPLFFIQAANDYSIRPTLELAASLEGSGGIVQSRVYPAFGVNHHEGHLLESRGPVVWSADVRMFLERYL